jgi:hypothetical protein
VASNRLLASSRHGRGGIAVDGYSAELKQRLERALASNSLISQGLDRTFPARILKQSLTKALPEVEIRKRYAAQS